MPAGTSPEVVTAFTPEILRGVKAELEALALGLERGALHGRVSLLGSAL